MEFVSSQVAITIERKQAEEALRESDEKYRTLVEPGMMGSSSFEDLFVKYLNPRFAEIWGGSVEENANHRFSPFSIPTILATVMDRYEKRMKGMEISPTYETIFKKKDGSKVYVEINAGMVTFQGEPADLVIVRDISERKKASQQQEILYQVLRAVSSQRDIDILVHSAVETIARILKYPHVCIAMPDEERTHWFVQAAAGIHAGKWGRPT